MISFKIGDLLDTADMFIAHGCNTQGVMGSGVAKAIREEYPDAFQAYQNMHRMNGLILGTAHYAICPGKVIFNCMTQDYYGHDGKAYAKCDAIESSLDSVCATISSWVDIKGFRTLSIPLIGCGLGGLRIEDVQPILLKLSTKYSILFNVWELPGKNKNEI